MKKLLLITLLLFSVSVSFARVKDTYRFYLGIGTGYANTDWSQLVVADKDDFGMLGHLPKDSIDGGALFDGYLGYRFTDVFAMQVGFTHLPDASLTFESYSIYFPDSSVPVTISSSTNSLTLLGKFSTPFSLLGSKWSAFAGAGLAIIMRNDVIANTSHIGADFSTGLGYDITQHFQANLVVDYESGYGRSTEKPVEDYIPFIYQVQTNITYLF